jgi:transcriptional regulator with XRE-family HTH domain
MKDDISLIANKIDFKLSTPEEIGLELGYRLKQQRLSKNWTQQELADRTGLDVGTIKNLENKGQCALLTLIRIVTTLDCLSDLSNLFQLKMTSIADMEKIEKLRKAKVQKRAR